MTGKLKKMADCIVNADIHCVKRYSEKERRRSFPDAFKGGFGVPALALGGKDCFACVKFLCAKQLFRLFLKGVKPVSVQCAKLNSFAEALLNLFPLKL